MMRHILQFIITLVLVILIGVSGLFLFSEQSRIQAGEGPVRLIAEPIPEEELAAQEEEAAPEPEEPEPDPLPEGIVPVDGTYSGPVTGAGGNFLVADDDDTVTFSFAGDILFDEYYAAGAAARQRGGAAACFAPSLLEVLRGSDVFIVNNEFPYTDRGTPTPGKTYTFRAHPQNADWLKDLGADLVTLANNHAYDFGEVSLLDTLQTLQERGIPYLGAGAQLAEASSTAFFYLDSSTPEQERAVMTVAILNATRIEQDGTPDTKAATETTPGVFRCYDSALLCQRIREAKEIADFVIVTLHWGTEKTTQLDWGQEQLGPEVAAAGADLIVGAHPHILQRLDYIGDMPVMYSLGNFYFTSFTVDTGVLQAEFEPSTKTLKTLRFVPCLQANTSVNLLEGAEKQRVLEEMRAMSPNVVIDEEGVVTRR